MCLLQLYLEKHKFNCFQRTLSCMDSEFPKENRVDHRVSMQGISTSLNQVPVKVLHFVRIIYYSCVYFTQACV